MSFAVFFPWQCVAYRVQTDLATFGGTEFIFNFPNARKFLFDRIIIETCKVKNWKVTYVFQNIFSLILIFALSITYPYIWMRSAVLFKSIEDIEWNSSVWKVWGILTNRSKNENFFINIVYKKNNCLSFLQKYSTKNFKFFWPSYLSSSCTVNNFTKIYSRKDLFYRL